MNTRSTGRLLQSVLLALGLLWLSACAVPLAPGYTIEREELGVRYVAAAPARLHLRASYRLRNVGNRDLAFLDASLPGVKEFGRQNLRTFIDGREVAAQAAPGAAEPLTRVPFDPPWSQKQRRELVLEYDLSPAAPATAAAAVSENSFHIADPAAFPELHPPKGFLAEGGERPKEIRFTVLAPVDFRIFAAGRAKGSRRQGADVEFRYVLPQKDFQPFVVAGRYQEQQVASSGATLLFWTQAPLPTDQAQAAAARLAATFQFFQQAFGSTGRGAPIVRIVETPAPLDDRADRESGAAGAALPSTALLSRSAFALGVTTDAFLDLAEHELAHTWFGLLVTPKPEAALLMGEGMCDYAVVVAAEARAGKTERHRRVASILRRYDAARARDGELPLLAPSSDFTPAQRGVAADKAPLFYIALEDQYGPKKVRRALARLVSSLRFTQTADEELRSALEQETRQDLADFFRVWLNRKDVPADFRTRYPAASEPGS